MNDPMQQTTAGTPVHSRASSRAGTASTGRVVDYIPRLATIDPRRFGLALATVDGDVCGVGD